MHFCHELCLQLNPPPPPAHSSYEWSVMADFGILIALELQNRHINQKETLDTAVPD